MGGKMTMKRSPNETIIYRKKKYNGARQQHKQSSSCNRGQGADDRARKQHIQSSITNHGQRADKEMQDCNITRRTVDNKYKHYNGERGQHIQSSKWDDSNRHG